MKYTISTPDIQKYALRFSSDDEIVRCSRADFFLDYDAHTLSVLSDCGNFKAQWTDKQKDFTQQIRETSKSMFLDKIAKRSEFDLDKSVEKTIEELKKIWDNIADEYDDPNFALSLQEIAIRQIEAKNMKDFFYKVNAVTGNLLEPQQIVIMTDYPNCAKTIAKVFEEFFLPVFIKSKK